MVTEHEHLCTYSLVLNQITVPELKLSVKYWKDITVIAVMCPEAARCYARTFAAVQILVTLFPRLGTSFDDKRAFWWNVIYSSAPFYRRAL